MRIRPRPPLRTMRFGTWNVRTLAIPGAIDILSEELSKYEMDLVALQETRWPIAGKLNTKDYIVYYSGNEEGSYQRGVGFAVSRKIESAVICFEAKDERLCTIRIKGRFKNISVMSVYAPTEDAEGDIKDVFYEMIEEEYRKLPSYDTKIIMGDFNAKIGKEQVWKGVAGLNSLHTNSNDNGIRLLSLAFAVNMKVMSTFFPRKDIHKVTWTAPNGITNNQIDHVLIDLRHSSHITNVRSIRKAECGSDHYLVLINLLQRIKIEKQTKQKTSINVNLDHIRNEKIRKDFQLKLSNRFQALSNLAQGDPEEDTIESGWTNIKETLQNCAKEVCGKKERKNKKPWFDDECKEKVLQRKEAKDTWLNKKQESDREEYKKCSRETVRTLRRKKREWVNKILEKAEQDRTANNSRDFYRSVRFFRKGYSPMPYGIKNKSGKLVIQSKEGIQVWQEYFKDLLNVEELEEEEEETEEVYQNVEPMVPNPTIQEVENAIKELKNNKAPGEDSVPSELIKAGGARLAKEIHKLILNIWEKEVIPNEWKEAIVIPIHKKGDKKECTNYRGISLLNCTYKVLSKILQKRLEEYTSNIIGEHQAGFTRGRSTTDQIFILKEAIAKYYEFNKSFLCLFIDFSKAYDSISRRRLWKIMEKYGIPKKLINLSKSSISESRCKVKINGEISEKFDVSTGVRQGDGVSPLLFNLALEEALQEVRQTEAGITIGTKINVLAFADDVAIMAESKEELKVLVTKLLNHTQKVGLKINEGKTKIMECGRATQINNDNKIEIEEYNFEKVNNFTYLGVMLTNNNEEDMEIQQRINAAHRSLSASHKLLSSRILSHKTKLRIYKTIIRPVLLYGSENWVLSKKTEKCLIVFENKILRKIYGPTFEDGEWRIRHNAELRQLYTDPDIVAEVRGRRMRWAGHVLRKEDDSLVKNVLLNNPEGRRPPGRPKLRWRDQVRKDLRRLGRREEEAMDREIWRQCVGEAKYHPGYQEPRQ